MKQFVIDKKSEGKKLFRFVKTILPGLKNNEIFKLIRKKIITVNNKKQSSDYTLSNGDTIDVFLANDHFNKKGRRDKFFSVNKEIDIIFEDKNVLVCNKPAGLLAHPDKNEYKKNIYEMARSYLYSKGEYDPSEVFSPTPCHRLDKNTSGLIIIAKNHSTLKNITEQFRERKTVKTYLALVYGQIKDKILLTSYFDTTNNKVEVKDFKPLKSIPSKIELLKNNPAISATLVYPKNAIKDCTLIQIELWTGKKHQIRAHLVNYGHALLGDNKYYNNDSLFMSKKYNIKNYYLHSYKLQIEGYPEWTAPMPSDFKKQIDLVNPVKYTSFC